MKSLKLILIVFTLLISLSVVPVFAQVGPGPLHKGGVPSILGGEKGNLTASIQPVPVGANRHLSPADLAGGIRRLVPQEYGTIQAAIDAGVDGDTVLVSEGTYLENIRYKGKAIVVASLYLVDGDTTHIEKTIIDGSASTDPDSGSVVYFIAGEDTTSELCGLTVSGGTGTKLKFAGGWHIYGGGVLLESAGGRLIRNIIRHNRVIGESAFAGGISALCVTDDTPYLILERNQVTDNFVQSVSAEGGNYGESGGADLTGVSSRIIGNVFERDTVIAVNFAGSGGLGVYNNPTTGLLPTAYIKDNIFRNNAIMATGDTRGAGIYLCFTAEVTILENIFNNNSATSISGYADGGGLCVYDKDIIGYGRKMVMKNRIINNHVYSADITEHDGGGISLINTLATVSENEIAYNITTGVYGFGGGIDIENTSFRLENNIIYGNDASNSGGGVEIWQYPQQGTEQLVVNNTIFNNNSQFEGGGMAIIYGNAIVVAMNNIFWANTATDVAPEIMCAGTVYVYGNDIQGGGYAGNIESNPKFVDDAFHLSDSSSCIGAGMDSVQISGVWYRAPTSDFFGLLRPDPIGSKPDIGACENPLASSVTNVEKIHSVLVSNFNLVQNYPNPFNPSTNIKFQIPNSNFVTLEIYDLLGQKVATLVSAKLQAGPHTAVWNAAGFASGIYYYRLQAGEFEQVRKMVVLR